VTKAGAAENQKNSRVVPLMIGWIIEATEQMNASDGDTIVIDDCEMGHVLFKTNFFTKNILEDEKDS